MELKKEKFVRFYSGEKQQGSFLGGKADSSTVEKKFSFPLLNSDGRYKVIDTLKFGRPKKVYPEDHESWRKRILDPGSDIVIQWNRIFIISCLLALFVDPLYFFLPIIQGTKESSCVKTDLNLRIVVTIFRTIADLFYLLHVFIKFRTAYVAPNTRVFGKGELVMDPGKIARRYLRSDFFIDLIATLPLPQMVIWFIIPATRSQHANHNNNALALIVLIQYIPRLYLIFPLSSQIIKATGVVTKTAWAGAAYNLLLYMLASHLMNVPGIITDFDGGEGGERGEEVSPGVKNGSRRIIVANYLPVKAYEKEGKKWCFEWDRYALDTLILQLKDGLSPDLEIIYVGCLKADVELNDQEEVANFLWEKFRCVPTFLSLDLINKYYHGFCKHYLWPLFHYMLPLTSSHGVRFDRSNWLAYVSANKIFADKVYEVINPDDDYVWIQDYHLMILPTMLRKKYSRIKVGFFLHSPFPSSEIYRTLPVRDEILRALLNCDLVGFQTFDYARHFLSCCSRMLGLDYQSKRGYIGIDYFGRTVTIKILPVGIHMGQIQNVMSLPDTAKKAKELKEKYEGKIVLLGIDDMDMFKGIGLKFLAMGHLLDQSPSLRGRVVLVQITNPPRSRGDDIKEVEEEVKKIAGEINRKHGKPGYEPIVCINGPVSTQDKIAHYAISECVVVNAVRDGMNLVPYEYTVSRQSNNNLDMALGHHGERRKSMIIVSEFIGCSPSLSGAIRVNPWDIESVATGMSLGAVMNDREKELRHEKHYKYVSSHDVAYWARSFDQDLKRACEEHYHKRCWGIGLGLGFRVVALGPNFKKLSVAHIVSSYKLTNSRLILLDYDGTMLPEDKVDKAPSEEVISILNGLCSDPKNIVFIVSGRGRDTLSKWFSTCPKLGLSAEHGYFTRWSKDSNWESRPVPADVDWKKVVLPIMKKYAEATDGSSIEEKESALVWHHLEADPDFGTWQAKELLDHLESVLANEPVVVKRGQHIVEVKPQDVSKGLVFQNLLASMQSKGKSPDFVLCIGDDRSDEDMFESIASSLDNNSLPDNAEVFACTVGQKPSMAKYYLDDPAEVIKMLQGLSAASTAMQLPPKSPVHQVASVEDLSIVKSHASFV